MYSGNTEVVVKTDDRYYNTVSNLLDVTDEAGLTFTLKETLKQYMWPGTTKIFFNVRSLWYEEIAPFRRDTIMVLVYTVEYNSDCSFTKN